MQIAGGEKVSSARVRDFSSHILIIILGIL